MSELVVQFNQIQFAAWHSSAFQSCLRSGHSNKRSGAEITIQKHRVGQTCLMCTVDLKLPVMRCEVFHVPGCHSSRLKSCHFQRIIEMHLTGFGFYSHEYALVLENFCPVPLTQMLFACQGRAAWPSDGRAWRCSGTQSKCIADFSELFQNPCKPVFCRP